MTLARFLTKNAFRKFPPIILGRGIIHDYSLPVALPGFDLVVRGEAGSRKCPALSTSETVSKELSLPFLRNPETAWRSISNSQSPGVGARVPDRRMGLERSHALHSLIRI